MKRSAKLKTQYKGIVFSVLLFCALMIWFIKALGSTGTASKQQALEAVKRSVENGISLCYSIEGSYPESIDYLTESYGVVYNKDEYIVHYECFASNIRPIVTVIRKEN